MAGIVRAREMVRSGMDLGIVLAKGSLRSGPLQMQYMILELRTSEFETVYSTEYGGVQFDVRIEVGDVVRLRLLSRYCAVWGKEPEEEIEEGLEEEFFARTERDGP